MKKKLALMTGIDENLDDNDNDGEEVNEQPESGSVCATSDLSHSSKQSISGTI